MTLGFTAIQLKQKDTNCFFIYDVAGGGGNWNVDCGNCLVEIQSALSGNWEEMISSLYTLGNTGGIDTRGVDSFG